MRRGPFTTIERAFTTLVTSDALTINGKQHPGLPGRTMPISEVIAFLQDPASPQATCDSLWQTLVTAPGREQWDLICLGLALPALRKSVARAARIWPYDPEGIQAEALDACIRALHQTDPTASRIFSTICIHVKTACRTYARDLARHAKGREEPAFEPQAPTAPWSHIDLVLLDAVKQQIITEEEAALIATCRLEGISSTTLAKARNSSRLETSLKRKAAEQRLVQWIQKTVH